MELFWEVVWNTPLLFKLIFSGTLLYLVGCIIYAFIPDKKTAEGEFKKMWLQAIDNAIIGVKRYPRSEQKDQLALVFKELYARLREATGGTPAELVWMSKERRDIWVYLMKRHNFILG